MRKKMLAFKLYLSLNDWFFIKTKRICSQKDKKKIKVSCEFIIKLNLQIRV